MLFKSFRLVDDFKGDLNMQRFAEQCRSITQEFQAISLSIKDVSDLDYWSNLLQKIEGKIREEFKDQKTAQRIRGIQE